VGQDQRGGAARSSFAVVLLGPRGQALKVIRELSVLIPERLVSLLSSEVDCLSQVGFLEVRSLEGCAHEVRSPKVRSSEVRSLEIRSPEARSLEIRFFEVSSSEIRVVQVDLSILYSLVGSVVFGAPAYDV
jgi:hypothetical protein